MLNLLSLQPVLVSPMELLTPNRTAGLLLITLAFVFLLWKYRRKSWRRAKVMQRYLKQMRPSNKPRFPWLFRLVATMATLFFGFSTSQAVQTVYIHNDGVGTAYDAVVGTWPSGCGVSSFGNNSSSADILSGATRTVTGYSGSGSPISVGYWNAAHTVWNGTEACASHPDTTSDVHLYIHPGGAVPVNVVRTHTVYNTNDFPAELTTVANWIDVEGTHAQTYDFYLVGTAKLQPSTVIAQPNGSHIFSLTISTAATNTLTWDDYNIVKCYQLFDVYYRNTADTDVLVRGMSSTTSNGVYSALTPTAIVKAFGEKRIGYYYVPCSSWVKLEVTGYGVSDDANELLAQLQTSSTEGQIATNATEFNSLPSVNSPMVMTNYANTNFVNWNGVTNLPGGQDLAKDLTLQLGFTLLHQDLVKQLDLLQIQTGNSANQVSSNMSGTTAAINTAATAMTTASSNTVASVNAAAASMAGSSSNLAQAFRDTIGSGSNIFNIDTGASNAVARFHIDNTNWLGRILAGLGTNTVATNEMNLGAAGTQAGTDSGSGGDKLQAMVGTVPTIGDVGTHGVNWDVEATVGGRTWTFHLDPFGYSWVEELATLTRQVVIWLIYLGGAWMIVQATQEIIIGASQVGKVVSQSIIKVVQRLLICTAITVAIIVIVTLVNEFFVARMVDIYLNPWLGSWSTALSEALYMANRFFPLDVMVTFPLTILAFRTLMLKWTWLQTTLARYLTA